MDIQWTFCVLLLKSNLGSIITVAQITDIFVFIVGQVTDILVITVGYNSNNQNVKMSVITKMAVYILLLLLGKQLNSRPLFFFKGLCWTLYHYY